MNNKDYWKKRFIAIENQNTEKTVKYFENLEKQFKQANKKIEAELSTWYRRFAVNNNITLPEAKRLLNSNELKELKWDVNDYIKHGKENAINQKWLKELENASSKKHITRLEALKLQLQQQVEVLYGNQLDDFDKLSRDVYHDNYYHTAFEIQKGFNVGYDLQGYNERQLEKVLNGTWGADGSNFSNRIWKHKTELLNTLNNEITLNIIKGKSPDDAIKNIAKQFNVSKNKAGRLVMTESAYISSLAQKDCYKELDVERYEIVATLDSHTSHICQDLDGEVFQMSEYESGVTAPPFHPYCRSCTCPYFDDNYGERIARAENGEKYFVPSNMKYHDWYKKFVEGERKTDLSKKITLKDVKDVLLNKIGFKNVDDSFNDIDDELKINVTQKLLELENKFNCIHNAKCTIMSTTQKSNAFVRFDITNHSINDLSLSKTLYSDKLKVIAEKKQATLSKWSMPFNHDDDFECMVYTVTHEYGHILQNQLIQNEFIANGWVENDSKKFVNYAGKNKNQWFKWYINIRNKTLKNAKKEIVSIAKKNNPKFDITQNISVYGMKDKTQAEFFAEVFANSQLSKPNELGLAMQEWLKQRGF